MTIIKDNIRINNNNNCNSNNNKNCNKKNNSVACGL